MKAILPLKPKPISTALIWESDNPDVAVVNSKGVVTGISEGKAVITAYPANPEYDATTQTASYTVTVSKSAKAAGVSSIKLMLNKTEYEHRSSLPELAVKKSINLKAYTYDTVKKKEVALKKKDVIFYSDNENVISVSADGKVTARAEGSANVTAVSLKDPTVKSSVIVNSYVPVTKITLNAKTNKLMKGKTGILTVAQWNPEETSNKQIEWTATGADGSKKTGNIQAVELAVLPIGKSISDLSDEDYKDARSTPVITGEGERLVYRTKVATKNCTITAKTVEGGKTATCKLIINGEVTALSLKPVKGLSETEEGYSATIKAGRTLKLTPVIKAEYGADKTVKWVSSGSENITVKKGTIKVNKKAVTGEKAVITLSSSGGKHVLKVNVTVE
ncbi:MAG: Ig-like domain-containing protein [Lachnospiraceae bacterium]|nr:Ig-like domain-containing protein [Lachnospiraceae bacterium]